MNFRGKISKFLWTFFNDNEKIQAQPTIHTTGPQGRGGDTDCEGARPPPASPGTGRLDDLRVSGGGVHEELQVPVGHGTFPRFFVVFVRLFSSVFVAFVF